MRKYPRWIFLLTILLTGATHAGDAVRTGNRPELFIDSALIDSLNGSAELLLHHPVRRNIALVHDAPWEGNACGYHTIFKDDTLYRMYYKAWHISKNGGTQNPVVICYAESKDGITWSKPDLGRVEYKRSKQNNIILAHLGEYGCHDFSPFIDTNPKALPHSRYKAV